METTEQSPCPEWHELKDGQCMAIYKTFKQWSELTGIGIMIPGTYELITYGEFRQSVNEVLSNYKLLTDIREEYCKAESALERGREYQEEFNRKMEKYNGG